MMKSILRGDQDRRLAVHPKHGGNLDLVRSIVANRVPIPIRQVANSE